MQLLGSTIKSIVTMSTVATAQSCLGLGTKDCPLPNMERSVEPSGHWNLPSFFEYDSQNSSDESSVELSVGDRICFNF